MKHLKVKIPFVEFNSLKFTLSALKEFNLQRQFNNYQNTKLIASSLFKQKAISTPGGKMTTGRGFRKIFIDGLEHNKSTESLLYFLGVFIYFVGSWRMGYKVFKKKSSIRELGVMIKRQEVELN